MELLLTRPLRDQYQGPDAPTRVILQEEEAPLDGRTLITIETVASLMVFGSYRQTA